MKRTLYSLIFLAKIFWIINAHDYYQTNPYNTRQQQQQPLQPPPYQTGYQTGYQTNQIYQSRPRSLSEENEAIDILNRASSNLASHYLKIRAQFINNLQEDETALKELREFKARLALNLSRFNYENFQSEGVKRQVKRLSKLQLDGLPTYQYENAEKLLNYMNSFLFQDNVMKFENTIKFQYQHSVLRRIQLTNSSDELLHYWKEWRSAIGPEARTTLINYRNYYRRAATLNGHVTPSKTWYLYYEDDHFLSRLTTVIENLTPLYKELHAYIRHSIREKYPHQIPYYGPIPHHFMEQVMEQDWYSKSAFSVPYPHNTLPDVADRLNSIIHNATAMLNQTIWFYEHELGLTPFSQIFYERYCMPLYEPDVSSDCKSIAVKFPPEYGFKYCPKVGFKKYLQMHQAVAKLEYYKESINLPIGLDDEACPGFSDAIGEAAVISVGSPLHLVRMKIVDGNYVNNNELKMNRLFRMAVHTLFSVFQYFVNEKFWVDFLDKKFNDEDMNCEYWRLQQEYAGVSPPEERNEDTFDAGYKFYRGISDKKSSTRSIVSEILGYQFFKSFCRTNEHYNDIDKNNEYENYLSNCDFSMTHLVGKNMQLMMSKGSQFHWHDTMEILTKTRGLDAQPMIEYYAPLYNWLKSFNRKYHVRPGWDKKEMCEAG